MKTWAFFVNRHQIALVILFIYFLAPRGFRTMQKKREKGKAGKKTMQPFVFRSRKHDLSGPFLKNPWQIYRVVTKATVITRALIWLRLEQRRRVSIIQHLKGHRLSESHNAAFMLSSHSPALVSSQQNPKIAITKIVAKIGSCLRRRFEIVLRRQNLKANSDRKAPGFKEKSIAP